MEKTVLTPDRNPKDLGAVTAAVTPDRYASLFGGSEQKAEQDVRLRCNWNVQCITGSELQAIQCVNDSVVPADDTGDHLEQRVEDVAIGSASFALDLLQAEGRAKRDQSGRNGTALQVNHFGVARPREAAARRLRPGAQDVAVLYNDNSRRILRGEGFTNLIAVLGEDLADIGKYHSLRSRIFWDEWG